MIEVESAYEVLELEMEQQQEITIEEMTFEEQWVYFELFNKAVQLNNYGIDKLPERVYKIWDWFIKQKPDLNLFVITSNNTIDPILVAKQSEYCYDVSCFMDNHPILVARWGNALVPYQELKAKAAKRISYKIKDLANKRRLYWNKVYKNSVDYTNRLFEFGKIGQLSQYEIVRYNPDDM